MKKSLIILAFALALAGCAKHEITPLNQFTMEDPVDNPGVSRDIVNLTASDAVTVAQMFCGKAGMTKCGESKIVKNVVTLTGKDGSANMYAVNFDKDEGFILVSATKKFIPILAEVEKGNFDDNIYESGVSVLLNEYNQSIDYYKTVPQEEIDKSVPVMWRAYEKKADMGTFLKTKSYEDDLMDLVPSAMHEWAEAGYEIYPLNDAHGCGLPESVYNQWYNIARAQANQHYSFEENSFIIKLTEYLRSQRGPLLSTTWKQGRPYNLSIPLYQGDHPNVGCVAVAVGQIMKYHQWPSSFAWGSMPNQLSSSITTTTPLSDFLYSVGQTCAIQYWLGLTGSDSFFARPALLSYNYSCDRIDHNSMSVYEDIMQGYPVYMDGDNIDGEGHAWVCDGAENTTIRETYYLKIISVTDNPLHFETAGQPYMNSYGTMNLHMNLGNGGSGDGWFSENNGFCNVEYSLNRKDLIHIRPNN